MYAEDAQKRVIVAKDARCRYYADIATTHWKETPFMAKHTKKY